MPTPQNTKKIVAGSIGALIVITLIASIMSYEANTSANKATATTSQTTSVPTSQTTSTPSNTSTAYKDGTYTASTSYYVPHGQESIKVTITVSNGVVSNSSVDNSEGDPESAQYQQDFADQYKSDVVGKNLNDVHLSFVAGASDTTDAFNQAIQQIESQAKA